MDKQRRPGSRSGIGRYTPVMNERELIRQRVEAFRQMQLRLCAERDARMNKTTQQIRQELADIHKQGLNLPPAATSYK